MSFPRYERYKDSGVEWLGEVPEEWDVSRLGFESWVRARLGWKGLKAEEYVDSGFAFIATPNIKGIEIDFENVNFISEYRYEESPEIKLRVGDVLLAKDGSTLGTVNVIRYLPRPTTVNSSIAVITPNEHLLGTFLFYLFQSNYLVNTIQQIKGGMGVPHLFQADLNKFYLPLPPIFEQKPIVTFLDHETSRINDLMSEQERLITLLKGKKQALISQAVTKGLNLDVPMKNSGIEWLGKVPEEWKIVRVKHIKRSIEQGWSPQCEAFPVETADEWGVLKVGCVNGGVFNSLENKTLPAELEPLPELGISSGDLLISRANTRELVGSAAVAELSFPKLLLCDKLYRLRVEPERCLPVYLVRYLGCDKVRGQIELAASGASSSMQNIAQSTILELVIALPPIEEQSAIVTFIDVETERCNKLITEAELAIDLLKERRSALISAAVTGKIDVRKLAVVQ